MTTSRSRSHWSALSCFLSCSLLVFAMVAPAGAQVATLTAQAATVVADEDENGAGDNVANPNGAPGLGSAAVNASGGAGNNGTIRFHIEWDITSLTEPVQEARAQVTTELGGFTLDTLFFAATGDGNGTIEVGDFETAAAQVPGVVLPIDNSGIFQFDVTEELNAAIAGGFSFFVLQGRVADESTLQAGTDFDRGVQIITTCPACTNTPDEFPQLLIFEPGAPEIPTLGSGALLALLAALGAIGVWRLRRG